MRVNHASSQVQLAVWLAAMAFVALTAAGCGPAADKLFPVAPVSGKIAFQGKAPEGGQVFLKPVNAPADANYTPVGTVKADGTFQISTYGKSDGAPPGDYVVLVQWFKPQSDGSGPGPNVIPKKYASPTTSPIKVTVKEGANELPAIAIE